MISYYWQVTTQSQKPSLGSTLHKVRHIMSTELLPLFLSLKTLYCTFGFLVMSQAFKLAWHEGLILTLKKCNYYLSFPPNQILFIGLIFPQIQTSITTITPRHWESKKLMLVFHKKPSNNSLCFRPAYYSKNR